jgi:hypothetical protein
MTKALVSPLVNYFLANNFAKPYDDIEGESSKSVFIPFKALGTNQIQVQKSMYFASDTSLDWYNVEITAIEFVPSSTQSKMFNGTNEYVNNQPAAGTALLTGVLYISNLKRELIAMMPLSTLIRSNNLGKITFTQFNTQIWQNCYVEFTDITGLNTDNGLEFRVYYKEVTKK